MINDAALIEVREMLMDAMTVLYIADRHDALAQYLAANIVAIHEQIEIELLERAISC